MVLFSGKLKNLNYNDEDKRENSECSFVLILSHFPYFPPIWKLFNSKNIVILGLEEDPLFGLLDYGLTFGIKQLNLHVFLENHISNIQEL